MNSRGLRRSVLAIVLACAGGASLAAIALAQSMTEVRAMVVDASGAPAAGVPVLLEISDGQRTVQRFDGQTDSEGRAVWEGVAVLPAYRARVAAMFDGVSFYSEQLPLRIGDAVDLSVRITDVATDGRPLHLDTLHLIFQIDEPGVYRVLQFMTVSNAGDTAWAGGPELRDGRRAGVLIPLPAAASTVRPAPFPTAEDALPSDLQIDPGQVLDPRPVPPSGRQVAVTYDLVSEGEPVPVELEVPYPTQSVSILIGGAAASAVRLTDTNLTEKPSETIGDNQFELWTAEALAPGTVVRFTLGPTTSPLSTQTLALVGLGLALVLAALATLRGDAVPPDARRHRNELIAGVAALDRQHEREELGDAEYFQRRGAAIEQLMLLDEALGRIASDTAEPGGTAQVGAGGD
jgi:hypothetical protein